MLVVGVLNLGSARTLRLQQAAVAATQQRAMVTPIIHSATSGNAVWQASPAALQPITVGRSAYTQTDRNPNGTVYDYAHDLLGSITGLVTADGTLAGGYTYDPWGNAEGSTPAAYNPFQFAGAYEDSGTNLYQMKARFYQPATGRFTQLDPLKKNLLTGNRYQYASCIPTNRVDPSGMADLPLCFWSQVAAMSLLALAVIMIAEAGEVTPAVIATLVGFAAQEGLALDSCFSGGAGTGEF